MRRKWLSLALLVCMSAFHGENLHAQEKYTLKATQKIVPSLIAQEEKRPLIYVRHLVPPSYPPLARQTRLSGTIVVKLKIDLDGTVLSAESSPGSKDTVGFDFLRKGAENIVKTWTFGCVGCPLGAPFEHTIKFIYRIENEDLLPDHYVVMNLPDEVTLFTGPVTINRSTDAKTSKKGKN